MLRAHCCANSQCGQDSQRLDGQIRATGPVAQVPRESLFATLDRGSDCCVRHRRSRIPRGASGSNVSLSPIPDRTRRPEANPLFHLSSRSSIARNERAVLNWYVRTQVLLDRWRGQVVECLKDKLGSA